MLLRTKVRRYLKALLWHDDVPQSADCGVGLLLDNCNEKSRAILDSNNNQLVIDADGQWRMDGTENAVVFEVDSVRHETQTLRICNTTIGFKIHIYSCVANGSKRQDELDKIEERILYRIFNYPTFVDATTNEEMRSIFRLADKNTFPISVNEETEFEGNYTIRSLDFTLESRECISKTNCNDQTLCFDWQNLTELGDC